MHADTPPLIAPPAIIRPGEPWERQLRFELAAKGVPIGAVIAIVAEVKRLQDTTGLIRRPSLADVSKWSKLNVAMLPGLAPLVSGSTAPPPVLTYITGASSTANNTTYSFGTISIGTASADRLVVVVAGGHTGSGSFSVSSCSIGGTAATRVVTSSGAAASSAIFQLGVASGTSASISVTWSGGQGRALIFVYRITGLISQTATGNNNTSGTNSTSLSTTLATSGAGVVIAGLMTGGVYSPTWGGVVQDSTLGPENSTGAGASKTGVAANASYAVSANDGSGNNDQMALAVASWR